MRRCLFFLSFLCLIAGAVYQFSPAALEWSLQSYCRRYLRSELQYQKFTFADNALVIDRPSLGKIKGPEKGKTPFSATRIVIRYALKRQLACQIEIIEPELEYIQAFKELNLALQAFSKKRASWFDLSLQIEKGKLHLPHEEYCLFDFKAEKQAETGSSGHLNLDFGNGYMTLTASSNPEGEVKADLHLHDLNPKAITPILHYTSPNSRKWEAITGKLNGSLELKGGIAEGEIHLSDFTFANE